jgi:hypothetical protein
VIARESRRRHTLKLRLGFGGTSREIDRAMSESCISAYLMVVHAPREVREVFLVFCCMFVWTASSTYGREVKFDMDVYME